MRQQQHGRLHRESTRLHTTIRTNEWPKQPLRTTKLADQPPRYGTRIDANDGAEHVRRVAALRRPPPPAPVTANDWTVVSG